MIGFDHTDQVFHDNRTSTNLGQTKNGDKDLMRGHHDPYRCMMCGSETKTQDDMIEHFRIEHPILWPYVKKPSEFEEKVLRE